MSLYVLPYGECLTDSSVLTQNQKQMTFFTKLNLAPTDLSHEFFVNSYAFITVKQNAFLHKLQSPTFLNLETEIDCPNKQKKCQTSILLRSASVPVGCSTGKLGKDCNYQSGGEIIIGCIVLGNMDLHRQGREVNHPSSEIQYLPRRPSQKGPRLTGQNQ